MKNILAVIISLSIAVPAYATTSVWQIVQVNTNTGEFNTPQATNWATGGSITLTNDATSAGTVSGSGSAYGIGTNVPTVGSAAFAVALSTNQTITAGAYVRVTLKCNQVSLDTASGYSTTTGLYTPSVTGLWDVAGFIAYNNNAASDGLYLDLYHITGSTTNIYYAWDNGVANVTKGCWVRAIVNVLTTSDTFSVVFLANDASYTLLGGGTNANQWMTGFSGHSMR